MNSFLNYLLTLLLAGISAIHLYWAFGGTWGIQNAIPTTTDGQALLLPGFYACLGIALIFIGLIALVHYADRKIVRRKVLLRSMAIALLCLIGLVFLARSIGDFQYVGFFKQVHTTTFGILDTSYYSPLCVLLAVLFFYKAYRLIRA